VVAFWRAPDRHRWDTSNSLRVGHHEAVAIARVATCQFPVSSDVDANLRWIARQIRMAAKRGADVVHFPEGALSGYAGTDFDSFEGFDWDALSRATDRVLDLAGQLGIWVVLGSAHRFGERPQTAQQSLCDFPDR
jgi:predicted amidohydrolase